MQILVWNRSKACRRSPALPSRALASAPRCASLGIGFRKRPFTLGDHPDGGTLLADHPFKHDAGVFLERMWVLASLLTEHGKPIRMITPRHPGKILYEDEFQVVVDEWNHV